MNPNDDPQADQPDSALVGALVLRYGNDLRSGTARPIADYLPPPGPTRLPVLIDIIHVDLEHGWAHNQVTQPAALTSYVDQFPELREKMPALLLLIEKEQELRARADPQLTLVDYEVRFPEFKATLGNRQQQRPRVPGYEIIKMLDKGGMGIVYKARHENLKRIVALKMIKTGAAASAGEHSRFQAEAEAVARLQHPHIVQIYEVGTHDGLPFLALEFVDGASLAKKVSGTPQPAEQAAQVVARLALAIDYAHKQGIIHRDLKPANVLLAADGTPKITDFGLAKHVDNDSGQTQAGQILGTPSYMAPEQAAGHTTAGQAVDVYALGAILYELLTGRPPFRGLNVAETLLQVQHDEPVPPTRLQRKVPLDLNTICLKCLEKEPGKRYASAAALAEDLRRFLAGQPIEARPVGVCERGWRWCRGHRALAALAATLFLAIVGWLVTANLQRWQAEAIAEEAKTNERKAKESLAKEERARRQAEESDTRTRQLLEEMVQPFQDAEWMSPKGEKKLCLDLLERAKR